jgi:hypothetical protein
MKPALSFAPFLNPIRALITNELEKPKEDSFRYPLLFLLFAQYIIPSLFLRIHLSLY